MADKSDAPSYPMPGKTDFTADEEQQMRDGMSQNNSGGILREDGPSGAAAMRRQIKAPTIPNDWRSMSRSSDGVNTTADTIPNDWETVK